MQTYLLGPTPAWSFVDSDNYRRSSSISGTIQTRDRFTTNPGGTVGHGQAAIDIDASADDVWAVIGDFGGIGSWMPGIESCRVEGDDRILVTMGMEITERLVSKDDAARVLTYSITNGAPVETHQGVITVTPTGATSQVTWDVDATPDEMAEVMTSIYQQALEALKAKVGG
jgi:mxaD protein